MIVNDALSNGGNRMYTLLPCPFCGKSVAEVTDLQDCEMCANFEQEDLCPNFEEPGECGAFVVCNHAKGGCGAASGWHQFPEEAVEAWNKRS